LEKSVEDGQFYEAQQMYKTIYSREAKTNTPESIVSIQKLLTSGACIMLSHDYVNEGVELGLLLLQTYKTNHIKPSKETLDVIAKILAVYKPPAQGEEENKTFDNFIKESIRWTVSEGEKKEGDPTLHNLFGMFYWKIKQFGKAQKHFLRGTEPSKFADMLIEWATQHTTYSEQDLVITRAVLQYLCFGNLKDANTIFQQFVKGIKNLPQTPLLNFVQFLLLTLERDALPLFETLRSKYRPSLERDPTFQLYLNEVASVFFQSEIDSAKSFWQHVWGPLKDDVFRQ